MALRGWGDHRLWESNTDPGTLRYVVRYALDVNAATEVGYKKKRDAFVHAKDLTALGYYVEVFDTRKDYGW